MYSMYMLSLRTILHTNISRAVSDSVQIVTVHQQNTVQQVTELSDSDSLVPSLTKLYLVYYSFEFNFIFKAAGVK
jgi:hypothetical protein